MGLDFLEPYKKYFTPTNLLLIVLAINFGINLAPVLERPISDHWIYLIMAREVMEGLVPYRDFFFAGGPLFLYIPAFFYKVLGVSINSATVFTVFVNLLLVLSMYVFGERVKPGVGVLTAGFTITSLLFQMTAQIVDGTGQTTLFSILACYLYVKKRPELAGAFCGFAFLTRPNAAIVIAVIMILSSLENRFKEFAIGAGAVMSVFLFAVVLTPDIVNDSILYHFEKPSQPFYKPNAVAKFFKFNNITIVASILGMIYLFFEKTKKIFMSPSGQRLPWITQPKGNALTITIGVLLMNIAYFFASSTYFVHYFTFLIPFMVVPLAYSLKTVHEKLDENGKTGIALICLAIFIYSYQVQIEDGHLYGLSVHPSYDTMISLVNQTSKDAEIMDFATSYIPVYLSFMTGHKIPADYMDTSFQRIQLESDTEKIEEILHDPQVQWVVWNMRVGEFSKLPNYREMSDYIRSEYYPRHVYIDMGDVFYLSQKNYSGVPNVVAPEQNITNNTRKYKVAVMEQGEDLSNFGQLYYLNWEEVRILNGPMSFENPTTSKYLFNETTNVNKQQLVVSDYAFDWPLMVPKYWKQEKNGLVSESWVTEISPQNTVIVITTHEADTLDYVSAALVFYNPQYNTWNKLWVVQLVQGEYRLVYSEELTG